MRDLIRRWFGDNRGTTFEGIALSVSIMAVGFVASADVLDYMTKKHATAIGAELREIASLVSPTRTPGIDYEPTGSVPGEAKRPYVLDPCTGLKK